MRQILEKIRIEAYTNAVYKFIYWDEELDQFLSLLEFVPHKQIRDLVQLKDCSLFKNNKE